MNHSGTQHSFLRWFGTVLFYLACSWSGNLAAETAAETDTPPLVAKMESARSSGELALAERLAGKFMLDAQQRHDQLDEARAHYQMALNALEQNDYPTALAELQPAIAILEKTGPRKELADAYSHLGQVYRFQSRYQQALDEVYRAMEIYLELQDRKAIGDTYQSLGTIMEKVGQYEPSLNAHLQALQIHHEIGDDEGAASDIYNLGHLYVVLGDYEKALGYFRDVLQMDIRSGNKSNIAYSHNKLGLVYNELGQRDKALEHLNEALRLFESIPAPRDADWSRSLLAEVAMDSGDLDKATAITQGIIERARAGNFNSLLVDTEQIAAEVALRKGDPELALQHIDAGAEVARNTGERQNEARFEELRARAYRQMGDWEQAYKALEQHQAIETKLLGESRIAAMANVQAQGEFIRRGYQIEQLENAQKLQAARLDRQRLRQRLSMLGGVGALIVLALVVARYTQRRHNRELRAEVSLATAELSDKNRELEQAYQRMEHISLTDKLTGLRNRHFLESLIDGELEHCLRQQAGWLSGKSARPERADLVIFLVDIDHFKRINDCHGHSVGDDVLRQFRRRLEAVFRTSDYLVRWGGEEFMAVARFTDRLGARQLAERLMETVRNQLFSINEQDRLGVTCSVGYVCYPLVPETLQQPDWKTLVHLGDLCLYAAKYSGRDTWIGLEAFNGEATDIPRFTTGGTLEQWARDGDLELATSLASASDIVWQPDPRVQPANPRPESGVAL